MPHFYFDQRDGAEGQSDSEGLDFTSAENALQAAKQGLADLARDALPEDGDRELSIEVLDEDRRPLFRVTLHFVVRPLG